MFFWGSMSVSVSVWVSWICWGRFVACNAREELYELRRSLFNTLLGGRFSPRGLIRQWEGDVEGPLDTWWTSINIASYFSRKGRNKTLKEEEMLSGCLPWWRNHGIDSSGGHLMMESLMFFSCCSPPRCCSADFRTMWSLGRLLSINLPLSKVFGILNSFLKLSSSTSLSGPQAWHPVVYSSHLPLSTTVELHLPTLDCGLRAYVKLPSFDLKSLPCGGALYNFFGSGKGGRGGLYLHAVLDLESWCEVVVCSI